jgi:hypothetical protein
MKVVKNLNLIKEILASAAVLTICVTLIMSTTAEQVNATWVVMHGQVKFFGLQSAIGWCGVYAKVDEWAQAFIAWMPWSDPHIPEILNFHAAILIQTRLVKLGYAGADLHIEGLWDVYNVTYIFEPGATPGNYTLIKELWVEDYGTFSVMGGWKNFAVSVDYLDLITGEVTYYAVRPGAAIPIGDVSGPITGVPDGNVNIWDLVHTAKAYNLPPGMNFNFDMFCMDFNFDFKIDVLDLTTIAVHIGETY